MITRIAFVLSMTALVGCDLHAQPSGRWRRRRPDPTVEAPSAVPTAVPPGDDPSLALGMPDDGSPADDLVLRHAQFAVSYNRFRNGPNWVSFRLRADDLGHTGRTQDHFSPDPMLPQGVFGVHHNDYSGSGFDRGHLCPSSARTDVPENNAVTFLTTNVLPQQHGLNAGPWEDFETWCSDRAREGRDLYIVTGGVFDPACNTHLRRDGNPPSPECFTIGRNPDPAYRIAVPRAFWKVVVIVDRDQTASDVSPRTEVIAVEMPNDPNVGADWHRFRTTVDAIEQDTGYELLAAVPQAVQRVIEAR